jgi:hypothetical protein
LDPWRSRLRDRPANRLNPPEGEKLPVVIAAILAHQGGWDEMLMVAGPIGIFAYILRRANRRAEEAANATADTSDGADGSVLGGDVVVHDGDVSPE